MTPTDTILRQHAEAKEAEFHRIMAAKGLRAPGSTVEDHRPKRAEVVDPGVPWPVKVRDGEQCE